MTHRNARPTLPDRLPRHPNPWEGMTACPQCGDDEWTLPVDPSGTPGLWRCVACHLTFDMRKESRAE